ncbi:hypothetical protein FisN_10Lh047 [Fistulifera solaris]|uniref:Uncharacterized protein n=1 Tax=Fistulifera solaris TaxID=1519565 RepID=A0A1Z5JTT6_FISSO|nr:hypothetical protein FisN_10Lh047 [Fistulifera solaris]|eukprot:GAX17198.1 hypothetical protein FisN_10Lh047 [Fistulifera solaris]
MLSRSQHSPTNSENSTSIHSNILREIDNDDPFRKYEVVQVLGEGSMGAVFKVQIRKSQVGGSAFRPRKQKGLMKLFRFLKHDKHSVQPLHVSEHTDDFLYGMKRIMLDRISPAFIEELKNEIDILRNLDHPNIVRPHEVYTQKKQIYLVMDLCAGGDLYTRSPYTEKQAGRITTSILQAIRYMHNHGVVHRDLKYENIMFESTAQDAAIKIIDFGLSKKFIGKTGTMTERVGTIYTMSPQVLLGNYSAEADLWAVGVIAFMMCSSVKPFYDKRRSVLIDQIMRCKYSFESPVWSNVSEDAKDFISKLIVVDPKERLDAAQALGHKWIVNRERLPDEMPSEEVLSKVDGSLLNYRHTSRLKKLALTVIAHRSTTAEMQKLRSIFQEFDKTQDGVLSFDEFRQALEKMNYPEDTLAEIFDSVDLNQNGHIMWTEFLAATIEAHGHIGEDRIAEAFDRIDADDSGYISRQNLKDFLGDQCTKEQVDEMMTSADIDKDGKISYKEFLEAFRNQMHLAVEKVALDGGSIHASKTR